MLVLRSHLRPIRAPASAISDPLHADRRGVVLQPTASGQHIFDTHNSGILRCFSDASCRVLLDSVLVNRLRLCWAMALRATEVFGYLTPKNTPGCILVSTSRLAPGFAAVFEVEQGEGHNWLSWAVRHCPPVYLPWRNSPPQLLSCPPPP